MPRCGRKYQKSNTNVYHIILRSINQQEIFYDDVDKSKFLKLLKDAKEKYQYDLYAYVLMDNHVHLLIVDKEDNLSKMMQSIATSYAIYFNKRYKRIGHVFYNRFKSKQINTLPYLINLIRYIHFNPEKAEICSYSKYIWSSYQSYFGKRKLIDLGQVLTIIGMNKKEFKDFHEKYRKSKGFILEEFEMQKFHLDDIKAVQIIKKELNIDNLISIQNLKPQKRDEIIAKIAKIDGIDKKQIARILGMNERMVYRAVKREKENQNKID